MQRKVNHRAPNNDRRQRVFVTQRLGHWGQDIVSGPVQFVGACLYKLSGTTQIWPFQKKGQTCFQSCGLHGNRFGLILGINIVKIGQMFQVLSKMSDTQSFAKTGPAMVLGLLGAPERKQAIDIGSIPLFVPKRVIVEVCRIERFQRPLWIVLGKQQLRNFGGNARRE